jgi:predicted ATPase
MQGTRLLTVLGPGGTGKTRVVRRYGRTWLGDWPGGVYFCDLSEARSPDGIFFAVASSLDVALGKDDPAVQLGHAIAGRGRSLVILDNFEQVVQHAQGTLGHWLDRAPDASFVVTSRERLHLRGEEIFPIEPLHLERDAIELFVTRARAQRPDFVLSDANRAAVGEVVRLLDGLPLAIELAAARVQLFSPAQLVERMRDRFALLAGARGTAARQATMHAAIDWSWELLAPWEQAAFAQCSIFDGGFTLEAAEAVLDLASWPQAPPAMDVVQALSDKSLLRIWVPAEQSRYEIEETYFGMYMTIHEYAAEKLEAAGQAAHRAAEQRHGRYFATFGPTRRSRRFRSTAASSGAVSSRSSSTISSPRAAGRCDAPTANTRSPPISRSGKCSSCRDPVRWGSISARRYSRSNRSMRRSVPRRCRRTPRRIAAPVAARIQRRDSSTRSRLRAESTTGVAKPAFSASLAISGAIRDGWTTRGRISKLRSRSRAPSGIAASKAISSAISASCMPCRDGSTMRECTSSRRSPSTAKSATVASRVSTPAIWGTPIASRESWRRPAYASRRLSRSIAKLATDVTRGSSSVTSACSDSDQGPVGRGAPTLPGRARDQP